MKVLVDIKEQRVSQKKMIKSTQVLVEMRVSMTWQDL